MLASGIPIRLMAAMAAILSVGLAKVEIAVIQSPESNLHFRQSDA